MTEQEIVEYLKENKTKGIAFGFMPKEVKEWCCIRPNYFNDFLLYKNGAWRDEYCFVNPVKDLKEMTSEEIILLALPDYFQIQQEEKGEWVEFDVDQKGNFHCFIDGDIHYFFWVNWDIFLQAFPDEYTAFGGWQYEGFLSWYMQPMLRGKGNKKELRNYEDNHEESTPTIPVKIRFWREVK